MFLRPKIKAIDLKWRSLYLFDYVCDDRVYQSTIYE